MSQRNAKGVFLGLAASALALGSLAFPSAALAVNVNKSVIYDAKAAEPHVQA